MRKVNTVFEWCNDIVATRTFYTELLGLEETFYDEGRGWLNNQAGDTVLVFMQSPHPLPKIDDWAVTPAYDAGKAYMSSWVLEVAAPDFDRLVSGLRGAGVESLGDPTDSPGGRAFFVRDPMGKTIEIFSAG